MKKKTVKELVYLRSRPRRNGTQALFLRSSVNGTRKDEYLKLYLIPERTKQDREKNRETLAIAEGIKAQRVVELQRAKLGIDTPAADNILFYDYLQILIDRREGKTKNTWNNCRNHLMAYEPNLRIRLVDITPRWVAGFREYLEKAKFRGRHRDVPLPDAPSLSQGTKLVMMSKLCCVFATAVKEGLLSRNPAVNVERFKKTESNRQFLTIDEIRRLSRIPAPNEALGRAFFFSCLTGLRWSDVEKLTWGEVQKLGDVTRIVFTQKKTRSLEYLDINEQAVGFLGQRQSDNERVFVGLPVIAMVSYMVAAWVKSAGINKHITFHCARHSFAIMMLEAGVDLYTLSKLMGHKSIETTQIYAKILDKTKREAVARIPKIF